MTDNIFCTDVTSKVPDAFTVDDFIAALRTINATFEKPKYYYAIFSDDSLGDVEQKSDTDPEGSFRVKLLNHPHRGLVRIVTKDQESGKYRSGEFYVVHLIEKPEPISYGVYGAGFYYPPVGEERCPTKLR